MDGGRRRRSNKDRSIYVGRGVEALTSTSPMAIFSRAQFATPVSHVTKDNILNTLNKVGVNFQRTKKSYALFCLVLSCLVLFL